MKKTWWTIPACNTLRSVCV